MKKIFYSLFALMLTFTMSGCGLMEDVFKGGLIIGLIIALIIGLLIWVLHSFSHKNLAE